MPELAELLEEHVLRFGRLLLRGCGLLEQRAEVLSAASTAGSAAQGHEVEDWLKGLRLLEQTATAFYKPEPESSAADPAQPQLSSEQRDYLIALLGRLKQEQSDLPSAAPALTVVPVPDPGT